MALINIPQTDTFDQWRVKCNTLSSNLGDLTLLETSTTTDLVSAINELLEEIEDIVLGASATNLNGGGAGYIPYQSALDTTAFLAAGTSGQVLSSGGAGAPTWVSALSTNTVSTIVKRDANGDFAAGIITATLTGNVTGNLTGDVTGNVTGNVVGNVTGALTGNASTASAWQTSRTITLGGDLSGSVGINGSANVTLNATVGGTLSASITGNAATATKWATSRTITLGGDLSGSVGIDGSANVTLNATIVANSVALGTDTTGDYVASLVEGDGLVITNNSGEGATPTIEFDETYSPTFATLTLTEDLFVDDEISAGSIDLTGASGQITSNGKAISFNSGTDEIGFIGSSANTLGAFGPTSGANLTNLYVVHNGSIKQVQTYVDGSARNIFYVT